MADVRLSAEAVADYDEVMAYLAVRGGDALVEKYENEFLRTFALIEAHPGSGSPRPKLGRITRLLVVSPFSIYYEGGPDSSSVLILRILRGSRRVTRTVLRSSSRGSA